MKNKYLMALLLTIAVSFSGYSQQSTSNAPTFIKGSMNIQFGVSVEGTKKNIYDLNNIVVCNSSLFHGRIVSTPLKMSSSWFSSSVKQNMFLTYDLKCDVMNPHNISQTKNVGRIYGNVPITPDGAYHFSDGSLECSVIPIGNAGGMDSRFEGLALGKPLNRPSNWMDNLKRETINITRNVNGKTMTVSLKKYDQMEFRQHVLCAGPVQLYQSATVNGLFIYDYDKNTWFLKDMTVQYPVAGNIKIDRLSGNIRWVEDADRKHNGLGEYDFDIRVNEPPATENDAFASSNQPTDESAFFATDTSSPSLTGTMKYKDVLDANGDTQSSVVDINLAGNNISKQQTMILCKLLLFSSVVPMNSD